MELIIGSGINPKKLLGTEYESSDFINPITLDINQNVKPDVLWDLNNRPLPFDDNYFDTIHAYHVLEHIGRQGDYLSFFEEFNEYYRILKNMGTIRAIVPSINSPWLWGDPGHTRALPEQVFYFLSKKTIRYNASCESSMTDYSSIIKCDFVLVYRKIDGDIFSFVLQARKDNNENSNSSR